MRALLVAIGVMAAAGPLEAQRPQTRTGFWIGFGVGYGQAEITCDACARYEEPGFTSFVRLGGTLSPRVLLGGDISGWTRRSQGSRTELGTASATVLFYPARASGFYVRGGAGFSFMRVTDGGETRGGGVGLVFGLGYDLRVGRNISLTAVSDLLLGSIAETEFGGTTAATDFKFSVLHLGLAVTFH